MPLRLIFRRAGLQVVLECFVAAGCLLIDVAHAAEVSAKHVTEILFQHDTAAGPVDFRGKDLSFLDLAGLDFKAARLDGANLSGADLSKSSLKGANLEGARLDGASISRADFSGANLQGATLLYVSAHATAEPDAADTPNFENANLARARIAARLDGANFRNADLTGVQLGQLIATWGSYQPRAILNGADFSNAKLVGADLHKTVLQFTHFAGADLSGANLSNCDLTKADLTGANLTGADLSGADLDGALLTGATGLAALAGAKAPKNLDKALR